MVKRFDVYLVTLDPTCGSEIQKTRPALVVSPNEMHNLNTVIIAPMTTKSKNYPTRIPITFAHKKGFIVLDQIRTVDKSRLVKYLGSIDQISGIKALDSLREMFEF